MPFLSLHYIVMFMTILKVIGPRSVDLPSLQKKGLEFTGTYGACLFGADWHHISKGEAFSSMEKCTYPYLFQGALCCSTSFAANPCGGARTSKRPRPLPPGAGSHPSPLFQQVPIYRCGIARVGQNVITQLPSPPFTTYRPNAPMGKTKNLRLSFNTLHGSAYSSAKHTQDQRTQQTTPAHLNPLKLLFKWRPFEPPNTTFPQDHQPNLQTLPAPPNKSSRHFHIRQPIRPPPKNTHPPTGRRSCQKFADPIRLLPTRQVALRPTYYDITVPNPPSRTYLGASPKYVYPFPPENNAIPIYYSTSLANLHYTAQAREEEDGPAIRPREERCKDIRILGDDPARAVFPRQPGSGKINITFLKDQLRIKSPPAPPRSSRHFFIRWPTRAPPKNTHPLTGWRRCKFIADPIRCPSTKRIAFLPTYTELNELYSPSRTYLSANLKYVYPFPPKNNAIPLYYSTLFVNLHYIAHAHDEEDGPAIRLREFRREDLRTPSEDPARANFLAQLVAFRKIPGRHVAFPVNLTERAHCRYEDPHRMDTADPCTSVTTYRQPLRHNTMPISTAQPLSALYPRLEEDDAGEPSALFQETGILAHWRPVLEDTFVLAFTPDETTLCKRLFLSITVAVSFKQQHKIKILHQLPSPLRVGHYPYVSFISLLFTTLLGLRAGHPPFTPPIRKEVKSAPPPHRTSLHERSHSVATGIIYSTLPLLAPLTCLLWYTLLTLFPPLLPLSGAYLLIMKLNTPPYTVLLLLTCYLLPTAQAVCARCPGDALLDVIQHAPAAAGAALLTYATLNMNGGLFANAGVALKTQAQVISHPFNFIS